jgi:hypothetical protein
MGRPGNRGGLFMSGVCLSVGATLNAVVWIVMLEAANRLASDTLYLQSRHNRRLTNNHGAERAYHSGLSDGGLDMRIHHLAVLATVACVPLAACVPTYGSGYSVGYADGGYGYAPGPAPFVTAGGDYYGRGPYYGGGYGYRRPYGADGDWRGNDPRRYQQQQRYNQALVARQHQYNQALVAQQRAYNEAFVARQKAGLPSPPFQAPPFR